MKGSDPKDKELRDKVFSAASDYYNYKHKKCADYRRGDRIPFAGRFFDEREILSLIDASLDFWLTADRYARQFEERFSKILGVKHCALVNSGSSANLLAFMALTSPKLGERRIKRGDEVITVAAAFPTTVAPIVQYGAIPVFLDITIPSYNIDCLLLKKGLSERTRAVFLAHTLGNPFDVKQIREFCDRHDLWLIEDNCDALGSKYFYRGKWRYTGSFGHISTASFYPAHHMTMGEGGAILTNDPHLMRIIGSYRDWGRDCWCKPGADNTCGKRFQQQFGDLPAGYDHKYIYSHFGYNLKATDLQAAIGCAQLDKLSEMIEIRRRNWQLLRNGLADLSSTFILPEPAERSEPSWFGFGLTLREESEFTRERIVAHLESNGIQTRMLFAGNLIRHPCFDEMRETGQGFRVVQSSSAGCAPTSVLPNADRVTRDTFWIGVHPGISPKMVDYMVTILKEALR